MRYHTDHHTAETIGAALTTAGLRADGVHFDALGEHRSRSRRRGFEIRLDADQGTDRYGQTRRRKNTGYYGASAEYAATYDEWGLFIAELLRVDPDGIFGPYSGRDSFDAQTRYVYATDAYGLAQRAARDALILNSIERGGSTAQEIAWERRERVAYVRRVQKSIPQH